MATKKPKTPSTLGEIADQENGPASDGDRTRIRNGLAELQNVYLRAMSRTADMSKFTHNQAEQLAKRIDEAVDALVWVRA